MFEEKFDKKGVTQKNVALLDWDQKSPRFTSYLRSSQNFLACNFIEKATLTQVFSCEFIEISKNTVFKEHVWATISEVISETSGIFFSFLLQLLWCPYRRSLSRVFQKKIFSGKFYKLHREPSVSKSFLSKIESTHPVTLNRLWHRCFPVSLTEFLRTFFLTKHQAPP